MRADVKRWPTIVFEVKDSSESFVTVGVFSEISGWTPSVASQ